MPFDADHGVFYGADSLNIGGATQAAFVAWLSAQLEDADLSGLALQDGKEARVVKSGATAAALFKQGHAVVVVTQGPEESRPSGRTIGGTDGSRTYYRGARHELTLDLDMGVGYDSATTDGEGITPGEEEGRDNALAGLLGGLVRRGWNALSELGLNDPQLEADAEAQRDGSKRNPHSLTFFSLSLDTYSP